MAGKRRRPGTRDGPRTAVAVETQAGSSDFRCTFGRAGATSHNAFRACLFEITDRLAKLTRAAYTDDAPRVAQEDKASGRKRIRPLRGDKSMRAIVTFVLCMFLTVARAATVEIMLSQNFSGGSFTYEGVPIPQNLGTSSSSWSGLNTILPFNESLGTLVATYTEFNINVDIAFVATYENLSSVADEIDTLAYLVATGTWTFGDAFAETSDLCGTYVIPGGTGTCTSSYSNLLYHYGSGLGPDQIAVDFDQITANIPPGPGNGGPGDGAMLSDFTMTMDTSLYVTRYYEYIPAVPVPAASWLFSSVLGLLGFIKHRMTLNS